MAKNSNNVIIAIGILFFITFLNKKEISSHQFKISTDIFYIDDNRGPLSNLTVTLFKLKNENKWITVDKRITDVDGNIASFVSTNKEEYTPGTYRLHLETKEYFNSQGRKTSFPFIDMAFEVGNTEQRYHMVVHVKAMDGWGFHLKMLPEPTVDKSNTDL